MSEVTPRLRELDNCQCGMDGCELFGTLGKADRNGRRHVRGCGCPVCRGRRNRRKGDDKARRARKALGLAGANTRHEELWGGPVRVESKAGAQVKPIWTRFRDARAQSELARPIGDHRPFVFMASPDGTSEVLYVVAASEWDAVCHAYVEWLANGGAA
jgi:hypothetical protein